MGEYYQIENSSSALNVVIEETLRHLSRDVNQIVVFVTFELWREVQAVYPRVLRELTLYLLTYCHLSCLSVFQLVMLGVKLRALHMLGKCFPTFQALVFWVLLLVIFFNIYFYFSSVYECFACVYLSVPMLCKP